MIKLPFKLFNKSDDLENDYLGLLLKEKEGIIFLIRIIDGSTNIIAKERFAFSNNWDNLIEDIDEVLYRLELKGFKSPENCIFFVYSNLVDKYKREIKKIYIQKIKEIVKNLELKPLGYIEVHDAVIDLISNKETVPISAIFIEVNNLILNVFLYKNGKKIISEEVENSQNIVDTLKPIFNKIKEETLLPSRILVYDSKNVEKEVSDILSYTWEKDLFIHTPKVDIVNEEDLTNSLIDVFTRQLSDKKIKEEPVVEKKKIMGFVIGGDLDKTVPQIRKDYFNKPKQFLSEILFKLKQFKISKNLLFISGIVFIIASIYLIELYFHKTEIILTLPSQTIEKSLVIDDLEPDISKKSSNFTVTKKTTGNREVGEKAKGEVTIHNFSSSEIQFDKNTLLTSSNLEYLLDSDTKVASASLTSDASAKLPGKSKAKVTAKNIGEESNIAANNKFKIEDLSDSDYFAINEIAISGGTKKNVKSVSEADIANLEKELDKKSKTFQKNNIDKDFKKDHLIIDQLTTIKYYDLNYDKEVGEEATNVTLKTKADFSFVGLDNQMLQKEILPELNKEVEKGYIVDSKNLDFEINSAELNEEQYTFDINVMARASQKIDLGEIKSDTNWQGINKIQKIITQKYKLEKLEVTVDHPIGIFKNFVSPIKRNIDIKVVYK